MASLAASPDLLVLTAPASLEVLDLAHAMLACLYTEPARGTPSARMRFELAVIEVLGNIVEHAYAHDATLPEEEFRESRRVEVRLAASDDHLLASLSDNGRPVPLDLEVLVMPDAMAESGRGLALASAALEVFEYERIGDHNHWRMACRLT